MWRWVLVVMTTWKWVEERQPTRPLYGTFESWRALPSRCHCQEETSCHLCLNPRSMLQHIRRIVVALLPEMHVLYTSKMLGNVGLGILVLSGEQGRFGGKPGRMKGRVRAPLLGSLLL